jgi:hypothetical protein
MGVMDPSTKTEGQLLAEGWKRCFIADEPRLSEAVETYRELGFEVALLPVPLNDGACTECMRQDPDRYRVIYTRKLESLER